MWKPTFSGIRENVKLVNKFYNKSWVMRLYYDIDQEDDLMDTLCEIACEYDTLDLCFVRWSKLLTNYWEMQCTVKGASGKAWHGREWNVSNELEVSAHSRPSGDYDLMWWHLLMTRAQCWCHCRVWMRSLTLPQWLCHREQSPEEWWL